MTLKDIAQKLTTSIQTIPELVRILAEGLENAEAGSQIEVTAIQESGTKIATITIDEEDTDIYAPTSEVIYSTNARKIGKWIDNKDLYEKVIEFPIGNSAGWTDYTHSIASIETCVSVEGFIVDSGAIYSVGTYEGAAAGIYLSNTSISVYVSTTAFAGKTMRAILRYTLNET